MKIAIPYYTTTTAAVGSLCWLQGQPTWQTHRCSGSGGGGGGGGGGDGGGGGAVVDYKIRHTVDTSNGSLVLRAGPE